jgi:hypothetical protein
MPPRDPAAATRSAPQRAGLRPSGVRSRLRDYNPELRDCDTKDSGSVRRSLKLPRRRLSSLSEVAQGPQRAQAPSETSSTKLGRTGLSAATGGALLVLSKAENSLLIVDPATMNVLGTVAAGEGSHEGLCLGGRAHRLRRQLRHATRRHRHLARRAGSGRRTAWAAPSPSSPRLRIFIDSPKELA